MVGIDVEAEGAKYERHTNSKLQIVHKKLKLRMSAAQNQNNKNHSNYAFIDRADVS